MPVNNDTLPIGSRSFIQLNVYVAPGADLGGRDPVGNDRIERDIKNAFETWGIDIYSRRDNINDPNFTFEDREIPCDENGLGPKAERLIHWYLLNDIIIDYRDIAVFYIGGRTLSDPHYTGCSASRIDTNGKLRGAIILTNDAKNIENRFVFTHELGHILFARLEVRRINPGSECRPAPQTPPDENHSIYINNLMYPQVPPRFPELTREQIYKANHSPFLQYNNPNRF